MQSETRLVTISLFLYSSVPAESCADTGLSGDTKTFPLEKKGFSADVFLSSLNFHSDLFVSRNLVIQQKAFRQMDVGV